MGLKCSSEATSGCNRYHSGFGSPPGIGELSCNARVTETPTIRKGRWLATKPGVVGAQHLSNSNHLTRKLAYPS